MSELELEVELLESELEAVEKRNSKLLSENLSLSCKCDDLKDKNKQLAKRNIELIKKNDTMHQKLKDNEIICKDCTGVDLKDIWEELKRLRKEKYCMTGKCEDFCKNHIELE